MIWDLFQQSQISQARADAESAKHKAERVERSQVNAETLQNRFEKLTLVCCAMWELLRDKIGASEEELLAKIREVDLRDGKSDGAVKFPVRKCSKCERMMNKRHLNCIYCGEEKLVDSVFEIV